jgi:hypothetical protein
MDLLCFMRDHQPLVNSNSLGIQSQLGEQDPKPCWVSGDEPPDQLPYQTQAPHPPSALLLLLVVAVAAGDRGWLIALVSIFFNDVTMPGFSSVNKHENKHLRGSRSKTTKHITRCNQNGPKPIQKQTCYQQQALS